MNDRHGHLAGDEVLASMAAAVRQSLRAEDLAGRLGGDVFALAFPFTAAPGASAAIERLRNDLEGLTFVAPEDGAPFQVRVRAAVVEQLSRKEEAEALLEAARERARHGA